MFKAAGIGAILWAVLGAQPARGDIAIRFLDGNGQPVPGVACSRPGGEAALSDAAGTLVLRSQPSGLMPGLPGPLSGARILLQRGETGRIVVSDLRGRVVLRRSLSVGEKAEISPPEKGLYLVRVQANGRSSSSRILQLGRGMVFEGVEARAPHAAAAPAARTASWAAGIPVTCGKSGHPTRLYSLAEDADTTLDFSRPPLVPLHDAATVLEPETVVETSTALITRFADRARDRHAREDEYQAYDHYLSHYWEHRTAVIEIIDEVAKGGTKLKFNVTTQWRLGAPEFRAFYRGIGTVAEYHSNVLLTRDPADDLKYHTELSHNPKEGRAIRVGDRMEIEVSQFLDAPPRGRANYYGTTVLYIVGQGGLVPWEARGVFGDASTEREDSYPIPVEGWLGGRTTLPYQYSGENDNHFLQMASNLAPVNGQKFVLGRRVHHTNFTDGQHSEAGNPVWTEMAGKAGPRLVNVSCVACHKNNGRALPPSAGSPILNYVFKVGDAGGNPHPQLGAVFQPQSASGNGEGTVTLASWLESSGLRRPQYAFSGGASPAHYSARISPQLVGMGLLEAIPEAAILARADSADRDGDGISGRMRVVADPASGLPRLGRFGWKAGAASVAHQVAMALNTDIGVTTSLLPSPDCGSAQSGCGGTGAELPDGEFRNLVDYVALLGIRARRDLRDAAALRGESLFQSIGCVSCHVPTWTTGPHHPKAELRNQTIHPYTDLLLHDMGAGLADNMPEGSAAGSEWRTPPLWNIGLTAGVSGGEAYLHDGRARTLSEAVLWHGGEGQAAADRYRALPAADRDAIVKFLKSL